jgi:hypothetical protein
VVPVILGSAIGVGVPSKFSTSVADPGTKSKPAGRSILTSTGSVPVPPVLKSALIDSECRFGSKMVSRFGVSDSQFTSELRSSSPTRSPKSAVFL